MALRWLWYSGQGPLQYEDTSTYPDIVPGDVYTIEASRAPQHFIEDDATEFYHVIRKSQLDSALTSALSSVSIATSELTSKIDSVGSASATSTSVSSALSVATDAQGVATHAYNDAHNAQSRLTAHGI